MRSPGSSAAHAAARWHFAGTPTIRRFYCVTRKQNKAACAQPKGVPIVPLTDGRAG